LILYVLDASVAAKWFLSPEYEPLADEALELFRKYMRAEVGFVIPDLFWAELASAFWKAVRLRRFPKASAQEALVSLAKRDFPLFPSATLLSRAFEIATTFDRSVYDSLYVALALHSRCQLITADQRLANALAAHFPVKWLGAI
jgi:predicted nucleic acid-binding protein